MEVLRRNVLKKSPGACKLPDRFDGIEMVHIFHRRKLTYKV